MSASTKNSKSRFRYAVRLVRVVVGVSADVSRALAPYWRRAVPGERGGSNVVQRGRVVDLKSRLHDQHLVEGQRSPTLVVDVARQQQVRPAIEDHAQLASRRGDIIAAKRMVRMLEVVDVAVPDAARERDRPHQSVALERPADPRVRTKLSEVPGCEIGGRLEVVRWRPGDQVDRPADGVASIQGALRSPKHFDAIQIEKLHELHRRSSEVDAVEVHRGARIRAGVQDVGTDPADRELSETGVLRKGHRWREPGRLTQRLGFPGAPVRRSKRR